MRWKIIKEFFAKLILTLSVYFVWILILKDPEPYILDSGPFFAIPFTIITVYVWKILNKTSAKILNKIEDIFLKVILVLSTYSIWVIILNNSEFDVLDLIFDVFDMVFYFVNSNYCFINYDLLFAIPFTIVSIYGWKILNKKYEN